MIQTFAIFEFACINFEGFLKFSDLFGLLTDSFTKFLQEKKKKNDE